MKYRKKPVIIEALQWTGNNVDEIYNFAKEAVTYNIMGFEELMISTLEGIMHAPVGNYIIKGIQGEYYSCDPNIFEETYEKIED